MSTMTDELLRRALIDLLRGGEITMGEAARFAGVSRQAVAKWCALEGIDPGRRREARIGRRVLAVMRLLEERPVRRPSKRSLRRRADEAHVEWQQRKAMNDGDTRP